MPIPAPRHDRTALVTGASSGIGARLATRLADRGHGVTLVARRRAELEELAGELARRSGVRTEVITADLADEVERARVVDEVAERGLAVNVLVNNAGFSTSGPVARADPDREIALVRTDVEAVVHLCTLLVPGMVERRSGAILNVASTAAYQPLPGQAAYGAAKAFVLSYGHALRGELRDQGVSVTTLCPGPVRTGFAATAGFDEGEAGDALPRFLWVDADEVARTALAGLDDGRAVVIPGTGNRVAAGLAHLSPRAVIVPVLASRHPALHRPAPETQGPTAGPTAPAGTER